MRYIVTGGAGFIGSNLAETLAQHHDVVIIDNLATGRRVNIEHLLDHPRVEFIEGSITDLDLLMETFPGADGIFHQAAIPSVPLLASNEANVTGTVSMLVAAKDCGVPAVVAASSSSVYGDTPEGPGPWLAPLDADGAVVVPGPAVGDLAVVKERWCRRRVWRRWDS